MQVILPGKSYIAFSVVTLILTFAAPACAAPIVYQPVDISAHYNARMQTLQPSAAGIPEGNVVFGGVPFQTGVGGNNIWWGEPALGGAPGFIDIPVGVFGVQEVHTLINTSYGQSGPPALASLEFFGSDGAYFRVDMVGGDDIRDHFNAFWTNSINNTTTINVFSSGGGFLNESRVDKQFILLPSIFGDQSLETIRLHDSGRILVQNVILYGITVGAVEAEVVPEPSTIFVVSVFWVLGLFTYGVWRIRRSFQRVANGAA